MNLLIKHSKKFILAILLFALVITANFGLLNATICSVSATEVHGFDGFTDQVNVTIPNSSFSSNSSTTDGYPYTPKNWTYNTVKASNNVKHGLVNLSKTTFKNNYEKYGLGEKENPGLIGASSDNYALMINSRQEKSSSGYVSDKFTLKKNGVYHVSVNVYTDKVDGAASLYLFNGDDVFASITNINAGGDWSNNAYHFLISTKNYEDLELSLGLWQGSKEIKANACVMFDEVSAGQISYNTLSNLIKGTGLDGKTKTNYENICYISLDNENLLDSKSIVINNDNYEMVEEESANIANSEYSTFYFDNSALEIENIKENNICFESGEYELISNKVYKFSIRAKTENLTTGSAFFKAMQVVDKDGKTASVDIKSTTNKLDDNFTEYSIVIVSDPLKTTNVKFQLGLGTSSTLAKGKVTFNGMVASSVPYSVFSETDSNTKTMDLAASYDFGDIENLVGNFAFYNSEATDISGNDLVAINAPTDWEVINSSKGYNQKAGVYNVADFDKVIKGDLANFTNPGFISEINNESNNVLMLYNEMEDVLVCKSKSFSLTKNNYYKVSVWVNTQVDEDGANIEILDKDDNLVLGGLTNIDTNGNWEEQVFYIKSAYEDLNVNLSLSLGDSKTNAKGYAYFDNCFVTSVDEEEYTNALISKFDLTNPLATVDDNKPVYFKGVSNNKVDHSVSYLLNIEDLSSVMTSKEANNAKDTFKGENKNVLAIHSTNTDDYYTLTSKLNYYLESGSYYKVSVDVYTAYLTTDVEDGKVGASVKLTNLENGEFKNINKSNKDTNTGVWTTYTFLVSPNENVTSELVFALGSAEYACHGTALFGNIVMEKLADKTAYTELTAKANDTTKVLGTVTKEEEKEEEKQVDAEINWQLIVYTLTAVAVIIAVLGVGFKKIVKPGKKRVKKSTPDYDRDSSMTRQKYRRLAYIKRDKDIRKLEKELELLNLDRAEKEEKYKQLLSKVREVKLANRDGKLNSELASLNKNMTKASHNVSKIGIMVNKINNEIALMKTEGYMQGLERKLIKQDELAKAKGLSLEQLILAEDENVEINTDKSLDEAILKADKIIEDKKEEARLAEEKAEQERLEAERLEQERLEAERLEKERLEQERLEAERLEKEKAEAEANAQNESAEETVENTESNENAVEENVVSESEVANNQPATEISESEAKQESQESNENLTPEEKTEEVNQEVENVENVDKTEENAQNLTISNENVEADKQDSQDSAN